MENDDKDTSLTRVGFSIQYFPTELGQRLAVFGDSAELGNWNIQIVATEQPIGIGFWYAELELPATGVRWKWGVIGAHSDKVERWEEGDDRYLMVGKCQKVIHAVWGYQQYIIYLPYRITHCDWPVRPFIHKLPLDTLERVAVTGSYEGTDWFMGCEDLHDQYPEGVIVLEIFLRDNEILRTRCTALDNPSVGSIVARSMFTSRMRTPTFPLVVDSFWRHCDNVEDPVLRGNLDWTTMEIEWKRTMNAKNSSTDVINNTTSNQPRRKDAERLENMVHDEFKARKIVLRAINDAITFLQGEEDYTHRRESDLKYVGLSKTPDQTEGSRPKRQRTLSSSSKQRSESTDNTGESLQVYKQNMSGSESALHSLVEENSMWRARGFAELQSINDSQILTMSSIEGGSDPLLFDILDINGNTDVTDRNFDTITRSNVGDLNANPTGDDSGEEYTGNHLDEELQKFGTLEELSYIDLIRQRSSFSECPDQEDLTYEVEKEETRPEHSYRAHLAIMKQNQSPQQTPPNTMNRSQNDDNQKNGESRDTKVCKVYPLTRDQKKTNHDTLNDETNTQNTDKPKSNDIDISALLPSNNGAITDEHKDISIMVELLRREIDRLRECVDSTGQLTDDTVMNSMQVDGTPPNERHSQDVNSNLNTNNGANNQALPIITEPNDLGSKEYGESPTTTLEIDEALETYVDDIQDEIVSDDAVAQISYADYIAEIDSCDEAEHEDPESSPLTRARGMINLSFAEEFEDDLVDKELQHVQCHGIIDGMVYNIDSIEEESNPDELRKELLTGMYERSEEFEDDVAHGYRDYTDEDGNELEFIVDPLSPIMETSEPDYEMYEEESTRSSDGDDFFENEGLVLKRSMAFGDLSSLQSFTDDTEEGFENYGFESDELDENMNNGLIMKNSFHGDLKTLNEDKNSPIDGKLEQSYQEYTEEMEETSDTENSGTLVVEDASIFNKILLQDGNQIKSMISTTASDVALVVEDASVFNEILLQDGNQIKSMISTTASDAETEAPISITAEEVHELQKPPLIDYYSAIGNTEVAQNHFGNSLRGTVAQITSESTVEEIKQEETEILDLPMETEAKQNSTFPQSVSEQSQYTSESSSTTTLESVDATNPCLNSDYGIKRLESFQNNVSETTSGSNSQTISVQSTLTEALFVKGNKLADTTRFSFTSEDSKPIEIDKLGYSVKTNHPSDKLEHSNSKTNEPSENPKPPIFMQYNGFKGSCISHHMSFGDNELVTNKVEGGIAKSIEKLIPDMGKVKQGMSENSDQSFTTEVKSNDRLQSSQLNSHSSLAFTSTQASTRSGTLITNEPNERLNPVITRTNILPEDKTKSSKIVPSSREIYLTDGVKVVSLEELVFVDFTSYYGKEDYCTGKPTPTVSSASSLETITFIQFGEKLYKATSMTSLNETDTNSTRGGLDYDEEQLVQKHFAGDTEAIPLFDENFNRRSTQPVKTVWKPLDLDLRSSTPVSEISSRISDALQQARSVSINSQLDRMSMQSFNDDRQANVSFGDDERSDISEQELLPVCERIRQLECRRNSSPSYTPKPNLGVSAIQNRQVLHTSSETELEYNHILTNPPVGVNSGITHQAFKTSNISTPYKDHRTELFRNTQTPSSYQPQTYYSKNITPAPMNFSNTPERCQQLPVTTQTPTYPHHKYQHLRDETHRHILPSTDYSRQYGGPEYVCTTTTSSIPRTKLNKNEPRTNRQTSTNETVDSNNRLISRLGMRRTLNRSFRRENISHLVDSSYFPSHTVSFVNRA